MSPETEKDILQTFVTTVIGLILFRVFLWNVQLWPSGPHGIGDMAHFMLLPFVILIVTHFNTKTLLSFRFVKMCFLTCFWTHGLVAFGMAVAFMTGKLHC